MRSLFAICILVRLLLALAVAAVPWSSSSKYSTVLRLALSSIAAGFFLLRVFNLRMAAQESSTGITYWHNARVLHAAFYASSALLLASSEWSRWAFVPLLADVVFGVVVFYTWR